MENRTLSLAISTTKLTGRTLVAAYNKYLRHRADAKAMKGNGKPMGEQTIQELIGQNQGASSIPIDRTDIRGLKKILGKYGVDYAVTKDASEQPPRYLVFFKARDGDALTAAFREYSATLNNKAKKPSVLAQLNKFRERAASLPRKVREMKQERGL